MANKADSGESRGTVKLSGRFTPGSQVRLTKSAGPHQMRPAPGDEEVDVQTVDEDGTLEFSGTKPGERYFASGYVNGQPVEARLTGRADPSESFLAGYEPIRTDRQKLADGSWADEPVDRKDHDRQTVEGATWLAQDQVGDDVPQRSSTIRGSATPISEQEREWAKKQWRKQEPTNPLLEVQEDPGEAPARTGEQPDVTSRASGGSERSQRSEKDSERGSTRGRPRKDT
jgi:hypothetical protein